ncbi:cell division protein anillin-domain-containing protein [Coniella lustricola]|uniref:Cell division protein anillin-domain-containing protein n=1 Tax=Coniella lustricola TaxID=2025994 RepID=A0A2T3AN74_9PEZI|nr:cell division protein anillin-domain-containing protein [Coniella lustricola]
MGLHTDSSPFQSSPLDSATSPRLFWQNKNSENTALGRGSPSPTRRSSIERLQKASRVRNSNILALEQKNDYDPAKTPHVERPLSKIQGNAFAGTGISGYRDNKNLASHGRSDSQTRIPLYSPKTALPPPLAKSPPLLTRSPPPNGPRQASPTKSSLAPTRFRSSLDGDAAHDSDEATSHDGRELPSGRALHRHAKSVTFDAAPPQVNEYEMVTPDISSIGDSSREGSYDSAEENEEDDHYMIGSDAHEDSFDAALEDIVQTPVVLPDDWHNGGMADSAGDDYGHNFMSDSFPNFAPNSFAVRERSDSRASNGDHRPLPPLPPSSTFGNDRRHSGSPLGGQRNLPSPPPPPPGQSLTKADIQNIGNGKMTLEERLKLMMLSDDGKSAAELQRERRMRRGGTRDRADSQATEPELAHELESDGHEHDAQPQEHVFEQEAGALPKLELAPAIELEPRQQQEPEHAAQEEAESDTQDEETADEADDTLGDFGSFHLPPHISRESILKRVDGNQGLERRESDYNFSSLPSSPARSLPVDPDVPIPSTESEGPEDADVDASSAHLDLPSEGGNDDDDNSLMDEYEDSESDLEDLEDEEDMDSDKNMDSESNYSGPSQAPPTPLEDKMEEDEITTPRASSPAEETSSLDTIAERMLPEEPIAPKHNPFTDDLQSFMLPKPTEVDEEEEVVVEEETEEEEEEAAAEDEERESSGRPQLTLQRPATPQQQFASKPEYDGTGWGEPDEYEEEPRTPDSVIHRPLPEPEEEEARVSPIIPETAATIKSASGSKLKTRPSATPADIQTMREQRRHVSREVPDLASLGERHQNRLPRTLEGQLLSPDPSTEDYMLRHPSFKARSLTLDFDLGLSLDDDFERVIETSKRGYLMRQNTKVVTASDKDTEDLRPVSRSAGNSPVKQHRPQSWTVEPWNGQTRKKSLRKRSGASGPVPPMPGRESNAGVMDPVAEEEVAADASADSEGERGRLFVKVLGVKDLDLPIPKNERTWFSLTLDNGVHCVTTAWLELARNAPIGQEFELVVPNDLEFQLTLNVKLEQPPPQRIVQSQSSPRKTKTSTFSRVFASPKKRKEMELRQKEEEERLARQQREAQARQMAANPTAWDLLSPLAADDGSFARAYISLKEHETKCFGRPYIVDVACFNEWATEDAGFAASVKSKRSSNSVVRRAPYTIGKLELQLLFVPRPKGCTDDDMPKSMNSCLREMKAAEERRARNWEGTLSQQGGDCPYWRRRYFKLAGTKLTAYHEATRQPRATINLANAKRLIDDRRALTEKETTGKGGKRRKSAFGEEEEGYMFVEEGFRIRFNNGEIIDFYADNASDKEGWLKALSDVIGRDGVGGADDDAFGASRNKGKWCEVVLKREDTLKRRAEGGRRPSHHTRTKSALV